MNLKNLVRTTLVLCAFFSTVDRLAWAEDPHFLSVYQSDYGLKLYHDGKIDFAVERFIKALLLDPENKNAKAALLKIVDETSATENPRALKIARFIDQIEYSNFLEIRYRSLTSENARLVEFFSNNSSQDSSLSEKLQTIKSRQADHPIALPSVGVIGFATDNSKSVDLDDILLSLSRKRPLLLGEISFWEEQNNQLRAVRRTILNQPASQTAGAVANKLKSQLTEVENRVAQKDNLLETQHQNIEYFQNQLSSVRENFDQLQERFKSTDSKIAELTKKLTEMSLEIFEKDKILAQKDSYAAKLQQQISEANEKMNLVQRIIQEKDDRIASLENEMSRMHLAVNSQSASSNPQLSELKQDFKLFETQFKSQMQKSRERIIGLEIQFADLTQKYQALVFDIQTKDAQISLLKEDSRQKDINLAEYRKAFWTTNQKANELVGMVDIYRSKLSETKKALIAKDEELSRLKSQMTQEKPVTAPSEKSRNLSDTLDLTFSREAAH